MPKEIDLQYILMALGLTMVFVGIIGFERQRKHKVAGMTTHVLVALGSCALAIVSENLFVDTIRYASEHPEITANLVAERGRIIAGVITGVGFLGTGAILKTNGSLHGLTTASTVWISAIIGVVFGLGYNTLGIVVSIFSIFTLVIIKRIFGKLYNESN